jgi:hypothetical protein
LTNENDLTALPAIPLDKKIKALQNTPESALNVDLDKTIWARVC